MKKQLLIVVLCALVFFSACVFKERPDNAVTCCHCNGRGFFWPGKTYGPARLFPSRCKFCKGYGWIIIDKNKLIKFSDLINKANNSSSNNPGSSSSSGNNNTSGYSSGTSHTSNGGNYNNSYEQQIWLAEQEQIRRAEQAQEEQIKMAEKESFYHRHYNMLAQGIQDAISSLSYMDGCIVPQTEMQYQIKRSQRELYQFRMEALQEGVILQASPMESASF